MNTFSYNLPSGKKATIQPGTKILFACMAGDGHFNPLTSLALHLKSLGCDVRWYVGSAYAEKVKKLGIHHYPHHHALDITADNVNEFYPEREKIKSGVTKLRFDL